MGFSIALSSRTLLKNAVLVYGLATAFISAGPGPGWADAAPQTAEVARAYLEDELPAYIKQRRAELNAKHPGALSRPPPPCHACDLGAGLHVPHAVSWVNMSDPNFVNELFVIKDPGVVWGYWARVEAATARENELRGEKLRALHEACGFATKIPAAVTRILARRQRRAAAGGHGSGGGRGHGVLLFFRGDSHSRVTFEAVVRSLTHEAEAFFGANFPSSTTHADHVFCCNGSDPAGGEGGGGAFHGCSMTSGPALDPKSIRYTDLEGITGRVTSRGDFGRNATMRTFTQRRLVEGGAAVCVAWENRDRFKDDIERFGANSLQVPVPGSAVHARAFAEGLGGGG